MASTCPKCQSPIPDDLAYCPICGEATPTAVSAEAKTEPYAPHIADSDPARAMGRLARALGPNYEVRRVVGRGGFAEVYEVWDKHLERRLAAKVLSSEIHWTPGTLERFKHEARTVARLSHPAILPIHFVGDAEDLAYYVMPFVEGESLRAHISRRGKLSAGEAIAIARPVLDALDHAHEVGLIHRDIKPDNVMLDAKTGRALLVDFGIAKALDPERAPLLTQTGHAIGTPHFMSPEQAVGDQLDARSDLYSFGAMLFEMVTGEKPFDGETAHAIIAQHIADPVREPLQVEETVPIWLSELIVRCMQKAPKERFQAASEVLEALESEGASLGFIRGTGSDVGVGEIIQGAMWDMDELISRDPSVFPEESPPGGLEETVVSPPEPIQPTAGDLIQGSSFTMDEIAADAPQVRPPEEPPAPPEPRSLAEGAPAPSTEESGPPGAGSPEASPSRADETVLTPPEEAETARITSKQYEFHTSSRAPAERPAGKGRLIGVALAVLVVAGGGIAVVFSRGGLRLGGPAVGVMAVAGQYRHFIVNSLVEPVQLVVNGEVTRTLGPGERDSLLVRAGENPPTVEWRLIRPRQRDGREVGREFSSIVSAGVQQGGDRYSVIIGMAADRAMFAPLVTNRSNRALVAVINPGTPVEARCNCVIPARSRNVHIGYYPLLDNSTVRFFDARRPYQGAYRTVTDLRGRVDGLSGSVRVTVSMP